MQPENKPPVAFLCEEEEQLLSFMKKMSPAQKSALAQYLVDYAKQQIQTAQQNKPEPTVRKP